MSVTTEPSLDLLRRTRDSVHGSCVVCGVAGDIGLGLEFSVHDDGSVAASFDCAHRFAGYNGLLHGGVISALADGAMTNCLFAHGVAAVTAELCVRFRHPIHVGRSLTVTARITRDSAPLYVVEAELVQAGQLRAKATGKFLQPPTTPGA